MYYAKDVVSQGIWIMKEHNNKHYPIAIIRWNDGLNTKTTEEIRREAVKIVACLNYCDQNNIFLGDYAFDVFKT